MQQGKPEHICQTLLLCCGPTTMHSDAQASFSFLGQGARSIFNTQKAQYFTLSDCVCHVQIACLNSFSFR